MLVAVDGEVAVVEVDHGDARAHEPGEGEHRNAGAERESGVGAAQLQQVPKRLDPDGSSGWLPVAAVEVAGVEAAAAAVREEQRAVFPRPSWSSASSAIACNETARLLNRVLVCSTRPFAYARRIWTTPAARSTSPCSSANSSEGLSPVAAANTTIGPKLGPSRSASDRICAQESNGRCSRQRRPGFGTPRLAGFSSISFQATARFSTCRSACVASKRCPSGTVSRHAQTCSGESSARRTSPSSAVAFPSSQRSFATVTRSP